MSYAFRSTRASSGVRHGSRSSSRPRNNNRRTGSYIDPQRFVAAAVAQSTTAYTPENAFSDFALEPLLQRNLTVKGYTVPSPIQDQAIPVGLTGRDVIGQAGTGTGKTGAFALPLLNQLLKDRTARALIIAPTRELAQQIEEECRELAKDSGLKGALLIGGSSMGAQLRDLSQNPQIVIGTPGRIKDHMQRKTLRIQAFNLVVLDEVDRMLDMGFVHDVREIVSQTNPTRQTFFFSATMNSSVRTLINTFTRDPETIVIASSAASENVHQDIVMYRGNIDKLDRLHDLLLSETVTKAIVFDETQRGVERLNKELFDRGFSTEAIHGGKSQGQRQRALTKFKKNEVSILVATDVAARGIDVADITHVINYSLPKEFDDYIHRIGRAGRAGQIGYALTFVSQ